MRTIISLFILGAAVSGAAATAQAQAPVPLLASNCFQCHGFEGRDDAFGALAGEPKAELFKELKEMQRKPANANIMNPHANGYTDEQLLAISDYFSKLPKR